MQSSALGWGRSISGRKPELTETTTQQSGSPNSNARRRAVPMSCRPKPHAIGTKAGHHEQFCFDGLAQTGRLHFFYHSPSSKYPVRDVCGEQGHGEKTEPHIEKKAENYCRNCLQGNIVGFLRSREKYLFLFTTCKNPEMARYLNERFVVGYIKKARALWRGRWAVQGALRLVSFEDSFPLRDLFSGRRYRYMKFKKLDTRETEKVLARLKKGRNVLPECLREIARLKGGNKRLRSKCR